MVLTVGKIAILLSLSLSVSAVELIKAIAVFRGPRIYGSVNFSQKCTGGPVTIEGVISGLKPGYHGFHVHEKGDLRNRCQAAGPHFNPFQKAHGSQTSFHRHVGDLGNLIANKEGVATIYINDSLLSLFPQDMTNIIGRALVIHADKDDLGQGGHPDSHTTGHSGDRIACSVIGIIGSVKE